MNDTPVYRVVPFEGNLHHWKIVGRGGASYGLYTHRSDAEQIAKAMNDAYLLAVAKGVLSG